MSRKRNRRRGWAQVAPKHWHHGDYEAIGIPRGRGKPPVWVLRFRGKRIALCAGLGACIFTAREHSPEVAA